MSGHDIDAPPTDHRSNDAPSLEPRGLEPAGRRVADKDTTDISALLRFEREQIEREYADIERASAALRLAQPALQSWIKPPAVALPKSQPLWLLIGLLWLSTALVTVGAVAAIASFAG
jgi:hypothetical protein